MSCETKRKIVALYDGVYAIKGFKECSESWKKLDDMVFEADTNGELLSVDDIIDPSNILFCIIGNDMPTKFFTVEFAILEIDFKNVIEDSESCIVQNFPHGFDTVIRVNLK